MVGRGLDRVQLLLVQLILLLLVLRLLLMLLHLHLLHLLLLHLLLLHLLLLELSLLLHRLLLRRRHQARRRAVLEPLRRARRSSAVQLPHARVVRLVLLLLVRRRRRPAVRPVQVRLRAGRRRRLHEGAAVRAPAAGERREGVAAGRGQHAVVALLRRVGWWRGDVRQGGLLLLLGRAEGLRVGMQRAADLLDEGLFLVDGQAENGCVVGQEERDEPGGYV
jgi:hypothetical protein